MKLHVADQRVRQFVRKLECGAAPFVLITEMHVEALAHGAPGLQLAALPRPTRQLRVARGDVERNARAGIALQAYFERTRGANGVRIVGLREARRELLGAIRQGVSVGLVGDRDLTGGGAPVTLFGAPATLPLGPALLSIESGAPMYVVGVRRSAANGRYRGRVEAIPTPPDGRRRERVMAATASVAAAFEQIISDAPEQWWAVFFPIWPDLEIEVAETAASATSERAA